jgi:pyruvate formate lyase activating enzyme
MNNLPLIVDIKRHSLEDGPGIRSVVFFKGCPLRCIFCQNPEAQAPEVEIAFSARECIHCGKCADACPQGAIDLENPGHTHREMCIRCGSCVNACPGKGLRLIGAYYPVEVLTELLLRDLPFYRHSGGGVTLSGGEPTLYPDYLEPLLKRLKARGIHLTLETSGYFDYEPFKQKIKQTIGSSITSIAFFGKKGLRSIPGYRLYQVSQHRERTSQLSWISCVRQGQEMSPCSPITPWE